MTDREPDDLYDALRSRLADYGAEPPAPLWANIRAQLPPPVAVPQLRSNRRKRTAAVLLVVLLAFVGGGTWQWWHGGKGGVARQPARLPQREALAQRTPPAHSAAASAAAAASKPVATTAPERAGIQREIDAKNATPNAVAAVVARQAKLSANLPATGPNGAAAPAIALATPAGASRKRRFAARLNAPAGAAQRRGDEETSASRRGQAFDASKTDKGAAASATSAAMASNRSDAEGPVAGAAGIRGEAGSDASQGSDAATPGSGEMAALFINPLALRSATLRPGAVAGRPLLLPADTLPVAPAVAARRWAVQLLGGPARTYRQLSTGGLVNAAPVPNTVKGFSIPGTVREQEEEARTGFGLALQVRRVLNGRWSLSAGLGYQEYAMQRTYDVVTATDIMPIPPVVSSPAPTQPTTVYTYSQVSQRDAYRFLTVPVRLSYALGRAGGRLRCGLTGGADADLYLGGSSAGADAARHTWDAVETGPNRSLNLSLSGGLDLRYRLASRLELLAQPGATYFLNSLSKPTSGLTPRHLVGAGVLVGVSYDWR